MALNLILLAAGEGTRMQSDRPKVLHEIAGLPLFAHALRSATDMEGRRVIVTGHESKQVSDAALAHDPDGVDGIDECLRVGWIDGLPGKVDERRWKLRVSPRNPASNWSGVNKRKVRRLEREGRMTAAGRRAVELAKASGTWTFLDDVERLEVPPDLAAALDATPDARRLFERFPDSSRRGILEWIKSAKRPATRQKRVRETAEKAARNLKANFPEGRNRGPA